MYPNAFVRLIDYYYQSNRNLLLEGISLRYLIFLKCLFLPDISTISQHEN
jgi:hypothetical protein